MRHLGLATRRDLAAHRRSQRGARDARQAVTGTLRDPAQCACRAQPAWPRFPLRVSLRGWRLLRQPEPAADTGDAAPRPRRDRKSAVMGKIVSVRVTPGGRRLITKKTK